MRYGRLVQRDDDFGDSGIVIPVTGANWVDTYSGDPSTWALPAFPGGPDPSEWALPDFRPKAGVAGWLLLGALCVGAGYFVWSKG